MCVLFVIRMSIVEVDDEVANPFPLPLHVHPTVGFTLPASSSLFLEFFRVFVAFVAEGVHTHRAVITL